MSKTAERIAQHLLRCADESFSNLTKVGHVVIDFNRTADMQVYNEVVELIGESYEGAMMINMFWVRVIIQRKAGL